MRRILVNNPYNKTKTITNPYKKGPTHQANTGSLFAKSVGAVTNRKNYAERPVDPVDDQQCHKEGAHGVSKMKCKIT